MAKETQRSGADGAMELLGVGGFALFFGWMLITFYWLFAIFLQSLPTGERDTIQLFIFIGIALGYAICHFLAGSTCAAGPNRVPMPDSALKRFWAGAPFSHSQRLCQLSSSPSSVSFISHCRWDC